MSEPVKNPDELTGEALAAVVAEKVMGARRVPSSVMLGAMHDWVFPSGSSMLVPDFRPDRDIATAWEALLSLKDWRLHIWQDIDGPFLVRLDHINTLLCTIPVLPDGSLAPPIRSIVESDESFCLAACRAAIAAVEARG